MFLITWKLPESEPYIRSFLCVILFPPQFPHARRSEQRAEELPGSLGLAVPAPAVCVISTSVC